ncbi:MAG: cysteine--tRNA ligase, partial [bacterium]
GYLFEQVRVINQARAEGATAAQLAPAQDLLKELTGVLGLRLENSRTGDQAVEPFIQLLIDLRLELRAQKLYQLSDLIRNRLLDMGVILEDGKGGTAWRFK